MQLLQTKLQFLSLSHPFLAPRSFYNTIFEALLDFKASSDKANKLTTWNSTSDPRSGWTGVTCLHNRVSRLILEDLELSGLFKLRTSLNQLHVLSLKKNWFNGSVPDLSKFTALKLLFLSHNNFFGEFPTSVQSLFRLYRLDLSFKNFTGQISLTVNHLTHLLTLRLEENGFSGAPKTCCRTQLDEIPSQQTSPLVTTIMYSQRLLFTLSSLL